MRLQRVEWSRQARRDAADAADWYVTQGGLALGERFLSEVQASLQQVARFPASGSLRHAEYFVGLPAPLRFLPIKTFERYLLYYLDLPTHVEVIRVWDASRGLQVLLEAGE